MNKFMAIGRLVADPEVRVTQSGSTVTKYRLAVNRRFKREGEQEADFINCVAFGKNAEFAGNYLHKGTKIAIEGRLQTGSYTKDDGTKVYTTDIVVENHEFCESRATESAPTPAPATSGFSFAELPLDEVPW